MTIITMQNNELRRMIAELQKDNEELKAKQIRNKYQIDAVYNELFTKNDSLRGLKMGLLRWAFGIDVLKNDNRILKTMIAF